MSSYKSVALVGSGNLGKSFVEAFTANKDLLLVVLSRAESASSKEVPAGVKVASVDFTSVDSVSAALKENSVDVVVSTLGYVGLASGSQKVLSDAAKAAGVKLFLPSEWGFPTQGATEGLFGIKNRDAEYLTSIGIPTVRIFTGAFYAWLAPVTGYTVNQKISYVGDSDAVKASATSEEEIAGYVSYILTHSSPADLENKVLRIQGDSVSAADIAAANGATTDKVEKIPGDDSGFVTGLAHVWAAGKAVTGTDDNKLWVGHEWQSYKDFVQNLKK